MFRVNSTNDINYGAGQGLEIEKHFYQGNDNIYKRFFDEEDIRYFFKEWDVAYINEEKMKRYEMPKKVWSCALKCNK